MCVCILTICQQAGGTAVLILAACPQWISSGDFPAQMCSAQDKRILKAFFKTDSAAALTLNLSHTVIHSTPPWCLPGRGMPGGVWS